MTKLKCAFIVACIFLLHTRLRAQRFMHSYGATISVVTGKSVDAFGGSSSVTLLQTSFCYFPRYNVTESENSSVSIGLPLALGVGLSSNTYDGTSGVAFAYEVPLAIDYNFGYKSTMENDSRTGGYLGVGFSYYRITIAGAYTDFTGVTYGPVFRAGLRYASGGQREAGHGTTVGFFLKQGIEKSHLITFGFHVLVDL